MVSVASIMLELGTRAPTFDLPDHNPNTSTEQVSIEDVADGRGLLVAFICNHCPYVKHIEGQFAKVAEAYDQMGIRTVAIASNDLDEYPQDGPDGIAEQCKRAGFTFPYLVDADQSVAQAYHAMCTPDLFLFDDELKLVYRGQFDGSRPRNDVPVTGEDLRGAMTALANGEPVPTDQTPSMGCNIKWKAGNEPAYFQP